MGQSKDYEQQIAVFGESGSGKTVLLSSFYGMHQDSSFMKSSNLRLVADDIGQGSALLKNYLDMRDSSVRPEPTRFKNFNYPFSILLQDRRPGRSKNQEERLKITWHDYPGEWFEQEVSGPEEGQRRIETFRSLLGSQVGLLLVDAQHLADNAGEEERYLKSLFGNFRNALLNLKSGILTDGKRLTKFPRIWAIALSKADLLPDMDVTDFRDLLIKKSHDEIAALREVLGEFCESNEALSFGEDFVLLSSARFEPSRIQVDENLGLELLLPIAAALPLERQNRWKERKVIAKHVVDEFSPLFVKAFSFLVQKRAKNRAGKWAEGNLLTIVLGIFRNNIDEDKRQINLTAELLEKFFVTMQKAEDDPERPILLRSLR
jgi:hypothetical protein